MTNRTHRRRSLESSTLDTERQRAEDWADRVDEPAILTPHGCLLTVVGARVAAGQALLEQLDEA